MSEKWELNKYLIKEEMMMVWEEAWGMDNKMDNKVLTLNFIIIFLLTYGIFNPIVGVVFTSISMLIFFDKK